MEKDRPAIDGLVYGRNPVAEWLKNGSPTDVVWLADTLDAKAAGYFTALAKQNGAVVKHTNVRKLDELCGGAHQGVAAVGAQVEYKTLDDLLEAAQNKGEPPFLLIADGVEDPHNLGALLRSALLCGVHGVVIPSRGGVSVTPVVMKASAGAAAWMPVARVPNIGEAVRKLKKANLFVYCADTSGSPPENTDLGGPVALVVGGEGKGVSPLVRKLCDGRLSLAMEKAGGVDSFNVSVAGGILMYEVFRTRHPG